MRRRKAARRDRAGLTPEEQAVVQQNPQLLAQVTAGMTQQ